MNHTAEKWKSSRSRGWECVQLLQSAPWSFQQRDNFYLMYMYRYSRGYTWQVSINLFFPFRLRDMMSFCNVHRYADGCIFPENTNNKTINSKTAHRENRKHQFISYLLKIGAEGVFNSADISVFTRVRVLPSCALNPCRHHVIGLLLWSNNRSKYGTVCLCDWVPLTLLNGPYFDFPSASPDMCGKLTLLM